LYKFLSVSRLAITLLISAAYSTQVLAARLQNLDSSCRRNEHYADAETRLSQKTKDFEHDKQTQYVRLIRTDATYETLYYGQDGQVQKKKTKTTAFGTGFAYMEKNGDIYFLTNAHVAQTPNITSDRAKVDRVPMGSKKIFEESKIVENESDEDTSHHIRLARVAVDPLLDAAILKTKASPRLSVMPYKLGRSKDLRVGNYVYVRGFPLGVFQAVNTGRIVNLYDSDKEQGWDHQDFIVDALLSSGNSGSPVFAIDCMQGSFELVGLYHATYKQGSALNAVIHIDELIDFMTQLQTKKRDENNEEQLTYKHREALFNLLKQSQELPLFSFAGHAASVRLLPQQHLLLSVYNKDFPANMEAKFVIEDAPSPNQDKFGVIQLVRFENDDSNLQNLSNKDVIQSSNKLLLLYELLVKQLLLTLKTQQESIYRVGIKNNDTQKFKDLQKEVYDHTVDQLEEFLTVQNDK